MDCGGPCLIVAMVIVPLPTMPRGAVKLLLLPPQHQQQVLLRSSYFGLQLDLQCKVVVLGEK